MPNGRMRFGGPPGAGRQRGAGLLLAGRFA